MSLNESEKQELLAELEAFCSKLVKYKELAKKLLLEERVLTKQRVKLTQLGVKLVNEQEREIQTLSFELQHKYGSLKEVIRKYGGPAVLPLKGGEYRCEVFLEMFSYTKFSPEAFDAVMNTAIATVNIAIGNLQSPRMSESIATSSALAPPKAFIAHGGESSALTKLREFLSALNITPLVAEDAASQGRSVNDQVEWCLNNSDCAIILGTADDKELKDGKLYPRRNVHIEIGRIQERFPNKTIYLLEEGASFPSNISEKVYGRFTQGNMEKAFMKVVKELGAFGILRAERAES